MTDINPQEFGRAMLMTTHDTLFDLAFDRLIGHEGIAA